ncbi:hypothetical protein PQX77_007639 [Marasmius sp. AFHP31]|nr:hypothetical protein PQX77_007639 [Marasmius sp. AFHP31]
MANRIASSASAAASPPKYAKTSPSPVTAFAYLQLKQKTSSLAASDYWPLVKCLLSRTSQSIGEFQQVISPVPVCPLRLPAFLRCITKPYASPHPHPTSSEQPTHAGTRMVIFTIVTLTKATFPRAKRSHPLDRSPQPLSYELTVPIRKDSGT